MFRSYARYIKTCPYCGLDMTFIGEGEDGYWECMDCGCCLEPGYSSEDREVDWVFDTYDYS